MTNDEKEIQEKWAEKNPSGNKETTVEKMFGCKTQERAIDGAWANLRAPVNETVNSKWYFKKGFEARKELCPRLKFPSVDFFLAVTDGGQSMKDAYEEYNAEISRLNGEK